MLIQDKILRRKKNKREKKKKKEEVVVEEQAELEDPLPEKMKNCVVCLYCWIS